MQFVAIPVFPSLLLKASRVQLPYPLTLFLQGNHFRTLLLGFQLHHPFSFVLLDVHHPCPHFLGHDDLDVEAGIPRP